MENDLFIQMCCKLYEPVHCYSRPPSSLRLHPPHRSNWRVLHKHDQWSKSICFDICFYVISDPLDPLRANPDYAKLCSWKLRVTVARHNFKRVKNPLDNLDVKGLISLIWWMCILYSSGDLIRECHCFHKSWGGIISYFFETSVCSLVLSEVDIQLYVYTSKQEINLMNKYSSCEPVVCIMPFLMPRKYHNGLIIIYFSERNKATSKVSSAYWKVNCA